MPQYICVSHMSSPNFCVKISRIKVGKTLRLMKYEFYFVLKKLKEVIFIFNNICRNIFDIHIGF